MKNFDKKIDKCAWFFYMRARNGILIINFLRPNVWCKLCNIQTHLHVRGKSWRIFRSVLAIFCSNLLVTPRFGDIFLLRLSYKKSGMNSDKNQKWLDTLKCSVNGPSPMCKPCIIHVQGALYELPYSSQMRENLWEWKCINSILIARNNNFLFSIYDLI